MDKQTTDRLDQPAPLAKKSWQAQLRKPGRLLAAGAGLAVLVLLAGWVSGRAATVSTADARIAADVIAVSTDVSGRITELHVETGQPVGQGDLLYSIDDRQGRHQLAEYEAELASLSAQIEREQVRLDLAGSKSVTQIEARQADTRSANAVLVAARSNLAVAQRDYDRASGLFAEGILSQAGLDRAENQLDSARQALRSAEASLVVASAEVQTARITGDEARLIAQEINILKAARQRVQAKVERQKVLVEQHQIRSPISGVVDELFYDAGEHALGGFRVALLHNPDEVWVSANIKETEVRHVKEGAPVTIHVDSAPGDRIRGEVAVVRRLTLAEASLMPNPNAGGVFTKITQRIPVRISLEDTDVVLRPGSMVRVSIKRVKNAPAPARDGS